MMDNSFPDLIKMTLFCHFIKKQYKSRFIIVNQMYLNYRKE